MQRMAAGKHLSSNLNLIMDEPLVRPKANVMSPPLRIFLVEDSSLLRELVIETFAEIAGVVLADQAESEDEAFDKLAAAPCEILILDIELKQGNGINLLRRLALLPNLQKQIKIVFSNNAMAAYRRVAEPLGVHFFFDKTTEFKRLRTLLEQLGTGKNADTLHC